MHDELCWRLFSYDISDPKNYRPAHKVIKGYAERLQKSVFRARMDNRQTAELRARLAKILDPKDSLLVAQFCDRCAGRIVCTHTEAWDQPLPKFSVVLSTRSKNNEESPP